MTDRQTGSAPYECPACVVETALALLTSGCPDMARQRLEPLPGLILATLRAAYEHGLAEGRHEAEPEADRLRAEVACLMAEVAGQRREVARLAAAARKHRALERPRPPKPHERLTAALASGTITAERVAELLRVRPGDLPPIAAGRVTLAATAWRRLLAVLEEQELTV